MENQTKARILELINKNSVMLFMKGNRQNPQCGFSRQVVELLDRLLMDYATFDVLSDPAMRDGIKTYSDWPTIPQLYVNQEFVGGCDIVTNLFNNGELATILKLKKASKAPHIELSPKASEHFKKASAQKNSDEEIRLSIAPNFEHGLVFDEPKNEDFHLHIGDIKLIMDPYSATRAENLKIDFVEDNLDSGFSFENPNEPPMVNDCSVLELSKAQENKENFLLIDVRPQFEWDMAHISFAKPLSSLSQEQINAMDKNTKIIFHCHHGGRSRREAEKWRALGFTNLHNLVGGIDAWSKKIDAKVPVYTK